jgi:two-component system, NarL family, sensor kinase
MNIPPPPKPNPQPRAWSEHGELRVLNAVAEALNSSPDVRRALEQTLGLVAERLGLRTGWVWLLDPDSGQFYKAAERELPPFLQEPVRMAGRRRCWCIDQFREGELTAKNIDVYECSRLRPAFNAQKEKTAGLRYHASVPLFFQSKPLGIMNLTGPARQMPGPAELRLLSTIAYQVGIAIERARLAEEGARLARAEERTRLAREIHDTLAQGLAGIALNIESALNRLDTQPEQARVRLNRALSMARENLEEARGSVLDLRTSAALAGKPLAEALGALGRSFTSDTGVRVSVRTDAALELPPRVEAELFRIAQEALSNVRKHARAHRVSMSLRRRGRTVTLAVTDDGVGLPPGGGRGAGHGLVGMRERARLLGGKLQVRSRPGEGTTITARVPEAST